MSLLGNAKILGGIGALLILLGIIPYAGALIGLIGFILVFVAVKYISDETKDKSIFNNFLFFFIISIVGIVLFAGISIITFFDVGGIEYFTNLQTQTFTDPMAVFNVLQDFLTGIIIALLVLWVSLIISVIFLRKSFEGIAEHTNVKWFGTSGLLFLVGAATVIIAIGFIIILVALILMIIAFFSLPDNLPAKKA
jgi:uncharacterized membrane protein